MTEDEWLTCGEPDPMLAFLREKASDRKLRLFAVGCCRHLSHLLKDKWSKAAVRITEQFADGGIESGVLTTAHNSVIYRLAVNGSPKSWASNLAKATVKEASGPDSRRAALQATVNGIGAAGWEACAAFAATTTRRRGKAYQGQWSQVNHSSRHSEQALQAVLCRDIFGNPFRSATLAPSWPTSTVVALAEGIYQERAFDRMPILADALQDAGCDNTDILAHCRDAALTHVRGCWVIDLLTGRK